MKYQLFAAKLVKNIQMTKEMLENDLRIYYILEV